MSEDLNPLTEKFDKQIKEISKLREDVTKQARSKINITRPNW